jgi:hypothetical protein
MMARWLVNQANQQFGVEGLAELKKLAKDRRLVAGDLVQPPGATEWLYANEIPELKGQVEDYDDGAAGSAGRTVIYVGLAIGLLVVSVVGTTVAIYTYSTLPDPNTQLIGGKGSMTYTQMLVVVPDAVLHAEADATAPQVATLEKDSKVELLAKRGKFYKTRAPSGAEGWVAVDQVLPMYQIGGHDAMQKYDPLYNPDRYVSVSNAGWTMPDEKKSFLTVFNFMLNNDSAYPMTDLRMTATVKDAKGAEIETIEFPIKGELPPRSNTMVGVLDPEDKKTGEPEMWTTYSFEQQALTQPDLQLRWKDGVEVTMKNKDFAQAKIDIVEVRAVPTADVAGGGAPTPAPTP